MANRKIYLGRDNTLALDLEIDGTLVTADLITRAQFWFPAAAVGSAAALTLDTSSNAEIALANSATRVSIQAGSLDLNVGTHKCFLTVFDADNTNGLAWDSFDVDVASWNP